jgi:hypothetical protein
MAPILNHFVRDSHVNNPASVLFFHYCLILSGVILFPELIVFIVAITLSYAARRRRKHRIHRRFNLRRRLVFNKRRILLWVTKTLTK